MNKKGFTLIEMMLALIISAIIMGALYQGFINQAKTYAIQAGREIRVLVEPESVGDDGARDLAGRVAARIQAELKYPGQIRVMVLREVRAVDYAR